MRMWTRAVTVGALGLAAGGSWGCAEEREPINRVQPNALAKSFFVGEDLNDTVDDPEFYARVVVTDVGYGAAQDGLFTSTYAQPPSVIKWEVTEDLLIGRITYNRIENADSHGDGPSSKDGQVAYVFPIISHFDIRRDYNPTTGEESNVIVENSSDRPWEQREYFRVDWSQNLNTDAYDFDTLSQMGIFGGVSYEPLSYYVNDPNNEDAPHFATNEGYFDITTKAFATPGIIDLSSFGWGINSFPACYLPNDILGGSQPFGNCNPTELTLRMSFRRIAQSGPMASDYEPVDWDGRRFTAFGIFTGDRYGYARNYGMTDTQWHRFADRYNIWERSHAYKDASGDSCPSGWVASKEFPGECEHACYTPESTPTGASPNRDEDGNGTADECEDVGNGSQCDQFKQKCTMPYGQRTPTPVVWHYTKGSTESYFEGTEWATNEWDVAMRTSVRTAQYAECVSVQQGAGADAATAQATCVAKFPMYFGQQEENEDAVTLAREVDDCRAGLGPWHEEGPGEAWSDERMTFCDAQADSIGAARAYSAGVISIAKMPEMVTLCRAPLTHHDNPTCKADIQRFMPEADKAADKRAVLPEDIEPADCDAAWENRNDHPELVDADVLAACDNGFYARIGDLRYHQVNVIRTPQTPSPWGIMVDADDPRTGEKIHASINIWSHVTDLASQGHVDMMRYIKGELETADVTNGTYVRDWAAAADAAGGKGALGTLDRAAVERRKNSVFDGRTFKNGESRFDVDNPPEVPEATLKAAKEFFKQNKLAEIKASADVDSVNRPYVEARRLAAQDTATEAELITPAMMQLAGMDTSQIKAAQNQLSAGSSIGPNLAPASILRALNPTIRREMRQARELSLAARGACILEADTIMSATPNTLALMADVMERKFGPWGAATKDEQFAHAEKIRKYIAQRYQYGVIIHEMGHSIGLRHNFVSSYYAWGFRPQYWQLRTNDGALTTKCTDVSADGENCVGPRYFDPPTKNETDNMILMFQQSSVMDYPGELAQDMIGLGAYDFAAARMFYGQTAAVHARSEEGVKGKNNQTILNILDTFGGIIGYQYVDKQGNNLHYTQLQKQLELISNCAPVDVATFKPKHWDTEKYGEWDALLDGLIVAQKDGTTTRCKSIPVDYVPYDSMRPATAGETANAGFYGGGPAVDKFNRLRVPYGFATDSWADLGNLSVYRHDNGADPYELFNFFITEQETRHIFDNYRRNRTSFSVRSQAERILGRYNEKMRDGAKGLALFANIYRDFFSQNGTDFDAGNGAAIFNTSFPDNVLASGIAFDHFTKQFARPESGEHQMGCQYGNFGGCAVIEADRVLRSTTDYNGGPTNIMALVQDGASGRFGQVTFGGKLVENQLSDNNGEYDRDYTMNAGSYYDKVYAPYLLTESADNFISDSLGDFVDPRYRATSMADLFPDGYRRFLANNLTGDDWIKGMHVEGTGGANSNPVVDADGFLPALGQTTWWTPEPTACFPADDRIACAQYGCPAGSVCTADGNLQVTGVVAIDNPNAPTNILAVDPQVGWEQWKWLVAQTLLYLPENQKREWINLLGMWEIGADNDPEFANRIELHIPNGPVYVARTYGTETIFGRTVQRGVAARVLEYANTMVDAAYVTTPVTQNGVTWFVPVLNADGQPIVKFDSHMNVLDTPANCNAGDNSGCTCTSNLACVKLQNYVSLPAFIRQSLHDFRMADASMKGIYD